MAASDPSGYYEALDLTPDASPEEIKKAFKKKAMQYHPDKTDGDKNKEKIFKKITEAHEVLSNPQKKSNYDQFGNEAGMEGFGPGGPPNFNDIFSQMFGGGGGGPQFPFGGGGRTRKGRDMIMLHVNHNDLYYMKRKRVEFELLDKCVQCSGVGTLDPDAVINCLSCGGSGTKHMQIGPMMISTSVCDSCGGRGKTVNMSKACSSCKGKKMKYHKRHFEIGIPKGVTDDFELLVPGKGSYNEDAKTNNDIVFKFVYDIKAPLRLDENMSIHHDVEIGLEDVLCGFEKKIMIYEDEYTLRAAEWFNPSKEIVLKEKGLTCGKQNKTGDYIIHFHVNYDNCEKLKKYGDVMRKIFKKEETKGIGGPNVILCE